MSKKILAFSGSNRDGSFNRMLLDVAVAGARGAGGDVTFLDLRELGLPVYDGDLEDRDGLPEGAMRLKEAMIEHGGFLIASPEYNSSISPMLKNAIDWASRPREGEAPLEAFRGKAASLLAASPGYFGGYRGLQQVRYILGNIGCVALPDMFSLPAADKAFDDQGDLKDDKQRKAAMDAGKRLVEFLNRLS